jgi:hypothetical protein
LAATLQLDGPLAVNVWVVPLLAAHMLFRTLVLDPVLPVMAGSSYGPQVPLAALVTHDAPEPPLGGALADEVLGLGAGLVGPDELGLDELGLDELGSDELGLDELGVGQLGVGELGLGQLGLGEAELEDSEGDGDGSAEVVLVLGNGFDDCESLPVTRTREGTPPAGAALPNIGPQPVRTTMVVDTAIAGHISLVFTGKLLTCWKANVRPRPPPPGQNTKCRPSRCLSACISCAISNR